MKIRKTPSSGKASSSWSGSNPSRVAETRTTVPAGMDPSCAEPSSPVFTGPMPREDGRGRATLTVAPTSGSKVRAPRTRTEAEIGGGVGVGGVVVVVVVGEQKESETARGQANSDSEGAGSEAARKRGRRKCAHLPIFLLSLLSRVRSQMKSDVRKGLAFITFSF